MATMVKEKRREKKKTKEKSKVTTENVLMNVTEKNTEEIRTPRVTTVDPLIKAETSKALESCEKSVALSTSENQKSLENETVLSVSCTEKPEIEENAALTINPSACESNTNMELVESVKYENTGSAITVENATDNYEFLNKRLECMMLPETVDPLSQARELELAHPDAYLKPSIQTVSEVENVPKDVTLNVVPSAPIFEEEVQPQVAHHQVEVKETKTRVQAMPLEEAVNMFGGAEMVAVKMLSEKEEAIVEAGPTSGPEHPLVDLLSTFRSSLRKLENERSRLTCGYIDEEKSRFTLWKIEKRYLNLKKQCKQCGTNIDLRASYEHAEFMRDRLPVARLRLESLLRDVQDSYCHHQHVALLTHCQIEEFISATAAGSKGAVREALSLVLQALRGSERAAAGALRRWAHALLAALAHAQDAAHLLFVLHHLFRQSRSVRWAARALRPRVPDAVAAARTLAVLDTLLAGELDAAAECTEEEGAWEELSASGARGAVGGGALREIDLLALLRAFPLRDLVARILLFTAADIRGTRACEWGETRGGRDVLHACCGVRTLLAVLRRAAAARAHYTRLRAALSRLAAAALQGLHCLYRALRVPYEKDLEGRIQAELEACFAEGLPLFGARGLPQLPTELLGEEAARDYCVTLIAGLHDKSPRAFSRVAAEAPALRCAESVCAVAHGAARRTDDHDLARIVMDFLILTGAKMQSTSCKDGCASAARAGLTPLLEAHPHLRTLALHTLADLAQVETLEPSALGMAGPRAWRPTEAEARALLEAWERRCPRLLPSLLEQLDYTPFTGVSLEVQLEVGRWACARALAQPTRADECWRVLRRLRTHAACWRTLAEAPPPAPPPSDHVSAAFALLASSWGHSIPEVCSAGVAALCALAAAQPAWAAHCLAPAMLLMAHSPDSIDLTPKFGELFATLVNSGPGAVQRALGRGGPSGEELLLRLVLSQLEGDPCPAFPRGDVVRAWLHALGRVRGAARVLDTAMLAARDWPALRAHAARLLQDANAKEHVSNAVRDASAAPLLCECVLRAQHELQAALSAALGAALGDQRRAGRRVHVDSALQKLNANVASEELVIYRSATAALAAPLAHPAHLTLWRLFFHLYLQRPPSDTRDSASPVGPLFYSGLIKSRTLAQVKKRLQETAAYHRDEANNYAQEQGDAPSRQPSDRVVKSESVTIEQGLFPELSIKDLTGESTDSDSDSDASEGSEGDSKMEALPEDERDDDRKNAFDMACYHTAAERMVREFLSWLEQGERARATPQHADIARFIPEQAMEAAWRQALSRSRPPPSPEPPPGPAPEPPAPPPPAPAPLQRALAALATIRDGARNRSERRIRSPLDDVDVDTPSRLHAAIDTHLREIDALAKEWGAEGARAAALDARLWELLAALREPRPLQAVARRCPRARELRCEPTLFHLNEQEWCISTGAEQAIKENRAASRAALRRLARARPRAAHAAAALHSIARRIRDKASAVWAVQRAWRKAEGAAGGAARDALAGFVETLAERWLCGDAAEVASLLARWGVDAASPLQQTLCGLLLSPRRLAPGDWPLVYTTLLTANLPPHTKFSYLSKFELGPWSRAAAPSARAALCGAVVAAQASGASGMLLELLGVHAAALLAADNLAAALLQLGSLAAAARLPPRQWPHVLKAAEPASEAMTFDQLGQLLRSLGALWWQARASPGGAAALSPHAEAVAALQALLLRRLVAAATSLSYQPERVAHCAWGALQESWAAWVTPLPSTPPLLPSLAAEGGSEYSAMLRCFHACLTSIMEDCPGSEIPLLQLTFEWCAGTHAACAAEGARQESRVQASELLATLATLPWDDHQWFFGNCLQVAIQICGAGERELWAWAGARWRAAAAPTLLAGATRDALAPRLAALLYLLTAPLRRDQRILDEATRLPWWELPEDMLGEALDRFFAAQHSAAQAYHDLPQFQVLLYASELRVRDAAARPPMSRAASRDKRARALSQWARAAAAPPLLAHVAQHSLCVLHTLTDLAPHLEGSEGELEQLLGRASVIMCLEPAAAAALPVWQQWVRGAPSQLAGACLTAASALTALPYCAPLADVAARALLVAHESGWAAVGARWSPAPWREARVFAERACLHAAYACARSLPPVPCADTLQALLAADINFAEDEAIVAVWICCACRAARGAADDAAREAGAALLAAWAAPPRRSLLRLVTLQADPARPTALHRLLCRLAECIVSPSAERAAAYEAASGAAGVARDAPAGSRPSLLPRLAARLFPRHVRYFRCELDAVADGD